MLGFMQYLIMTCLTTLQCTLSDNLHICCSQYCPVYPGGHTQVLLLEMHEPPFTQKQAGLERKENSV